MVRREKRFGGDSTSDSDSARQPWVPPPPMALIFDRRARVGEAPAPVGEMPPLPPNLMSGARSPLSPLFERVRSKRRTIMERVEGWWDLDLLEKRKTLLGSAPGSRRIEKRSERASFGL
ncbi:hypothetical protein G7046_g7625 [Stylonectria norvegica]|nr:hypothetical protein G7046_g7625 [Stylonectria norvegica]